MDCSFGMLFILLQLTPLRNLRCSYIFRSMWAWRWDDFGYAGVYTAGFVSGTFDAVSGNRVAPARFGLGPGAFAGSAGVVVWMVYGIPEYAGQSQLLPPTHIQPGP